MSQLTFRKKVKVCWQKQLRDEFLSEGTPDVSSLDLKKAIVRPVSKSLAKQIILKYEWLGTMSPTSKHYGIFFDNYCAGVTCVNINASGTAGSNCFKMFNLKRYECNTLSRGACVHWAPVGSNSKLVSWTCKLLKKELPHSKIILAYSDPNAGEIGTIYQACNWFYIGKTGREEQMISPSGRILNHRMLGSRAKDRNTTKGEIRKRFLEKGWKTQKDSMKGRYVQVLDKSDKKLVELVKSMSMPYPKRVKKRRFISAVA